MAKFLWQIFVGLSSLNFYLANDLYASNLQSLYSFTVGSFHINEEASPNNFPHIAYPD